MVTSWSYVPNDRYKSPGTIVRQLCRIVPRGGCLLLNIGPSPEGDFDADAYDRLAKVGTWMKINSEAIYETRPIKPYEQEDWVFTAKPGVWRTPSGRSRGGQADVGHPR